MKKPREEQIEAMLRGPGEWASAQLSSRDEIYNYHFGDFINVTLQELTQHLLRFGFPADVVNIVGEPGFATYEAPGKWNVVSDADGSYRVFYKDERGGRTLLMAGGAYGAYEPYQEDERGRQRSLSAAPRFVSMSEVTHALAARLYERAIIDLSSSFRTKHFPNLAPLPRAGEAWPDGIVRY